MSESPDPTPQGPDLAASGPSSAAQSPAPKRTTTTTTSVSSAGAAPRADQHISRRATIDNSGKYKVVIGHGSVVHPFAVIKPTSGPIKIGEYCIISEECVIENCVPSSSDMKGVRALFPEVVAKQHGQPYPPAVDSSSEGTAAAEGGSGSMASAATVPPSTLLIGDHNYFGPRSKIQGAAVGNCNVFEANSSVGIMSVVQDGCILRANTRVTHDSFVPNFTVVEGGQSRWHINGAVLGPAPVEKGGDLPSATATLVSSITIDIEGAEEVSSPRGPSTARMPSSSSSHKVEFTAPSAAAAFLKEAARHAEARTRMFRRQLKD